MFKDRRDAGKRLGKALKEYKNKGVLVLAIPRGGTEVGFQVAKYLNGEFSLLISRKLPYPTNPEAGFGAIAEDGSIFISKDAAKFLLKKEIEKIKKELERLARLRKWKKRKPLQVLYLSNEKKTISSIAEYLGKSHWTIRRWIYLYRKKGLEGVIEWVNRPEFFKGKKQAS